MIPDWIFPASIRYTMSMANGSPHRGSEARALSSEAAFPRTDAIWLTAGEAADAARVAHRQIAAWIATQDLSTRTGWRGGAEIRLVQLSDLKELVETIDLDCIRGSLEARGVFTGPRHSLTGKVPPPEDAAEGKAAPDASSAMQGAGLEPIRASDRQWASDLEAEIERLRGVIVNLREDHESLERHLDERVAVVSTRRLGKSGSAPLKEKVAEARPAAPLAKQPFRGGLLAVATGVVLGLAGAFVASQSMGDSGSGSSSDARQDSQVLAAERRTTRSGAPGRASVPGALPVSTGAALASSIEVEPVAVPAIAQPVPTRSGARSGTSSDGEEARSRPRAKRRAPDAETGPAPAALRRLTPPMALAEIERAIFSRKSAILADCAYSKLVEADGSGPAGTNEGPAGELVLGPCFGPARKGSSGALAVPGTHRVGHVACCRHHAFVERMTSASADDAALEGLRTEAAASLAEGVLPPLFRLRADRSASRFLREETRGWESAGLDGAAGMMHSAEALHEWKLAADQPGGTGVRVHLESWIRPLSGLRARTGSPDKGAPTLRRFRMTLLVQAAPRGDVLETFEWLVD